MRHVDSLNSPPFQPAPERSPADEATPPALALAGLDPGRSVEGRGSTSAETDPGDEPGMDDVSNAERGADEWVGGLRHLMTFDESSIADAGQVPLAYVEHEDDEAPGGAVPPPSALRDLVWRANNDMLTHVVNRGWFLRSSESSRQALVNKGHSHVLLLIDLDGFKQINDTWGHGAGDAVLIEVAARLRALCRPGDIVGRMGGDEFAVWAERVRLQDVPALARRFLSPFDEPVRFGEMDIDVFGSIGVVVASGDTTTNDLLNLADAALYDAKRKGHKSFCIFDDALEARMTETIVRERAVARALEADEFDFDLQPIVDLRSGNSWGVEVLARWDNPDRGRLRPAEFLPAIEAMNLFSAFDSLILEKAAASFNGWRSALRPPASIWVNVSPAHLEASFPEYLAAVIEAHAIRPMELVLELTEDTAANTPGRIAVLEAVRELGVQIAIDDFGTGFSQLAYLQDMPIDYVKLDRSFISAFHTEPRRIAIAESVILLAQAIGARVVAEGIEHQNELDLLTELGCDLAQGYLLSYPGSPVDIIGA